MPCFLEVVIFLSDIREHGAHQHEAFLQPSACLWHRRLHVVCARMHAVGNTCF